MTLLSTLLAFAVAIGVLVVFHELGHYSVARLCGVKVLRFSVGFGTPLLKWTMGRDRTEWTVCALPLGGYVRMLDERDDTQIVAPEDRDRAFNRQSVYKRFAIVAAGPVANFLLAIALYAGLNLVGVTEPVARVAPPAAGTLAARAGLAGGELITGVRENGTSSDEAVGDDMPVRSWEDLRWRLVDPMIDGQRVTLIARTRDGRAEYTLDAAGQHFDADGEQDFMQRLGLVPSARVKVGQLIAGGAAGAAGLRVGDEITAVDGSAVTSAKGLVDAVRAHPGKPMTFTVRRDGALMNVTLTPAAEVDSAEAGGARVGKIGAALASQVDSVTVRYGLFEAIGRGAQRTWDVTAFSVRMFGKMITGQASLKNLSGPVTIADYAGRSARLGLDYFVAFLALVSISLGVLNLLPIPVLDGGYLLYYAVEAITGRAVSERWQGVLQRVGIVCILALSAVALFNDMSKLLH
ncbi:MULTISPECIES: RIP metalloprotease RseP [Pandoraea]|uniref:Zinc metalloprotease n=1 Tax=Pandoraea pnomenusa TaxID=93220 RepID=A0A378YAW8_9BURK|nr:MULTISPECIES: RIP metalloprotease RseP [Pandoraea]AHB06180.1 zinc metalloprotease [Pandoraea pnomenusa 3kgm]AHB77771.1 RIP metalloprotease RseP [Pandoraea pnomenusa]AHN73939.1 RIP metalloprotease RseP [Pandoraea pnomenusa]AIU25326.1 RIP metalloprotease RseP [Pandoraea pnomenusa]ANC46442.1 RIP metalloprotease RseP [Pandoraea pnomenusa]